MLRMSQVEFFARCVENAVASRIKNDKVVRPMVASLFLTVKCNFRCPYCDDGSGMMYPDRPDPEQMHTDDVLRVLNILRRASPGIAITGGEPLLRKDIVTILNHARRLDFFPIAFMTNGFLLDKYMPILQNIDYLVISLDALDESRADKLIDLGRGGQSKRVIANLKLSKQYREEQKLPFKIILSTVVMPESIDDAWDVWEYCIEEGYFWNPMPHVVSKYPNPALIDNPRWQYLIDEVIRAKMAGARIYGNLPSLKIIRDFDRYECYPTTRPTVYPNGDLLYPCPPIQTVAANLLEIGDYSEALEIGSQTHGPIPVCDSRCHLGCFMESSLTMSDPGAAFLEVFRLMDVSKSSVPVRPRRPERTMFSLPSGAILRSLPSLPPSEIRRLRRLDGIENDFTSNLRIKGAPRSLPIISEAPSIGGCSR